MTNLELEGLLFETLDRTRAGRREGEAASAIERRLLEKYPHLRGDLLTLSELYGAKLAATARAAFRIGRGVCLTADNSRSGRE